MLKIKNVYMYIYISIDSILITEKLLVLDALSSCIVKNNYFIKISIYTVDVEIFLRDVRIIKKLQNIGIS